MYLRMGAGSEFARCVLYILAPDEAGDYCLNVFQTDSDPERRAFAVDLLKYVSDRRVLSWVPRFLSDSNLGVQTGGIGIVDQLFIRRMVGYEEIAELVTNALNHPHSGVREAARSIEEA